MRRASAKLPLPFRLLNVAGTVPGMARLSGLRLEPDALLRSAMRQTGLNDFGDPGFMEGLKVLLTSAEREAKLHVVGRLALQQVVVDDLSNRLLLEAAKRHTPDLFARPFLSPLIIMGLPRSGTTLLHRLLAEDPAHYAPRFWELARPLPQPGKPDDRRRKAERELALRKRMTRDLDAKHFVTADTPEEDLFMLASSFETLLYWVLAPVYSYLDWYLKGDRVRKYQEYRAWLHVLQALVPGRRLVLKAPEHTGALAALLQAVPEARLVQTHRDSVTVFGSFVSLNLTTQGLATDTLDVRRNAEANLTLLERELARNLHDREAHPEAVYDVRYDDLVGDPAGTVQAIYQHYGLALSGAYRGRLGQYIRENPQGKHGVHRYAASDVGFTDEAVRGRFAAYNERFGFAI